MTPGESLRAAEFARLGRPPDKSWSEIKQYVRDLWEDEAERRGNVEETPK